MAWRSATARETAAVRFSTNRADAATRYQYTGRDWDADVGLQYNRARWYDPATGRWVSEDPIGFSAGDPNLARYVGNGATYGSDPNGLTTGYNPIERFIPKPEIAPASGRLRHNR
jgi:RHS repeat-associated protein